MFISKVRFDGQMFLLDPEQKVDETKAAIVTAVRDGSDFVDFATIGHGVVSLLVTPNIPIRFEVIERSEEEIEELEANPPPIDGYRSFDFDF